MAAENARTAAALAALIPRVSPLRLPPKPESRQKQEDRSKKTEEEIAVVFDAAWHFFLLLSPSFLLLRG